MLMERWRVVSRDGTRLKCHEAVEALVLGAIQRLKRVAQRLVNVPCLVRQDDAADRDRGRQLAGGRANGRVANRFHEAFGGDAHGAGAAVVENDAELVGGVAAEGVAGAQFLLDDAGGGGDYLVADIEAERLVNDGEVVDCDDHERGRRFKPLATSDHDLQRLSQANAIELSGQLVVVCAIEETLLLPILVVDDTDDAACARGACHLGRATSGHGPRPR